MTRAILAGSLAVALATSQAAQVVDVSKLKASSVRVQQPSGEGREVDPSSARVSIKPWQYIAAQTGTLVTVAESPVAGQEQAWALPMVLTTVDDAGKQIDLEIVVAVENGLMMRGNDDVYSGDLFVGVLNKQNRSSTEQLGAPVHILLTGQVDAIDPAGGVQITHTNQPFTRVGIRARPDEDQVVIKARASFAPEAAEVPVPVLRPQLILRASPSRIQGYGLETTEIIVEVQGRPKPEGLAVTVFSSMGHLEPGGVLTLNAQGVATTRLRGDGRGIATVRASGAGFREAEFARVEFRLPRLFVGAALAGGLLGGFIRRRSPRHTRQGAILLGMAQGFGAAVLYAVGINLIGWAPAARTGAALVFGTALLGAWADFGALVTKTPQKTRR